MPATGTHPRQFTIGGVMGLVAGTAVVLAIALTPGFAPILGVIVIPSTIVGVGGYLAIRRLVELFYGPRCPGCRARALERRALVSFGERFFLCTACGVRCRQGGLGGYGIYTWKDASGPEFETRYARPAEEDPWNALPDLKDGAEAGLYSRTHLNLVRSKRERRPKDPNGRGLA